MPKARGSHRCTPWSTTLPSGRTRFGLRPTNAWIAAEGILCGDADRRGLEVLDAGAWHKRTTKEKRLAKKRRVQADKEELKAFRATSSRSKGKSEGKGDPEGGLKSKDQAGDDLCFSWDAARGPNASRAKGARARLSGFISAESA